MRLPEQKLRAVAAVLFTLLVLHTVNDRPLAVFVLCAGWLLWFWPISRPELALFGIAAAFFLFQNYVALKAGIFEFTFKDILLMPWYEPLLWGLYVLSMKRFVSGVAGDQVALDARSVAGVIATSVAFSVTSDSHTLMVATACSTAFLFVLFHTPEDLAYAAYALALGLVVELFGVWTGLWRYPSPDFLGIPFWFATMWLSVGLLGRRFAIPAAERLAEIATSHRAYRPGARMP